MHRVGRGLGGDALHAGEIGVKRGRHRHRQRADQPLGHHHRVARELEAACPEDRSGGLFGARHVAWRCEEGHLVVQIHQLLAVVHGLEHDVPVGLAFLQVGQEARHVTGGVGRGARGLQVGPVARRFGVEHMHTQRDHERTWVLERGLVEIADEAAHVPECEARRKRSHRQQAQLAALLLGRIAQLDPGLTDGEVRGAIDHLIAQFAAGVIGERQALAALPVGIEQGRDPVDELGRRPHPRWKTCRVQGGARAIAQQQQFIDTAQVLNTAGQRDADDQPEFPKQVALVGQQRTTGAREVVADPAPGHGAVDVAVPSRSATLVEFRNRRVGQAQLGIAPERAADVGTREQVELDPGTGGG